MTSSLLPTIQAKSDQLNAEDLIGGPRTVTVTGVKITESDGQPVWIGFEGDNGKPFKPCKTVRRLLVRVWGDDSTVYAGRSMTLYLDPEVKYGGMKVGGIRVSHVSHIDGPQSFFLTETRGKKRQITVKPLARPEPQRIPQEPEPAVLQDALAELDAAESIDALAKVWSAHRGLQSVPEFIQRKDKRKDELKQPAGEF